MACRFPKGWVLYDDSCGFCRQGVVLMARVLRRRGYDIAPLQTKWVRVRLGLSEHHVVEELRLLLSDGTLIPFLIKSRYKPWRGSVYCLR
jgi:predicted DCC family thiol-disulfide oxidoreductase YuxK